MRKLSLLTAGVTLLVLAGPAFAQSGQGGYLGKDPGEHALPSISSAPQIGSLQGGYLGKNPGGALKPATPASAADYLTVPTAWCENSIVPSRCRNRATPDHAWCADRALGNPTRYASCRRTMDFMGWPP